MLAAALAGVLAWRGRHAASSRPEAAVVSLAAAPPARDAVQGGPVAGRAHLPPSLSGTTPDPSLEVAERERRAAALEDGLPEPVRAARAEALAPLRAMQEEARMRAGGTSSVEIRALRERSFGTEAADRLEELDRQRAAWQQRIDDYRAAREVVEQNPSLDAAARARAIEALRAERFTAEERLRIPVLDGVERVGR